MEDDNLEKAIQKLERNQEVNQAMDELAYRQAQADEAAYRQALAAGTKERYRIDGDREPNVPRYFWNAALRYERNQR